MKINAKKLINFIEKVTVGATISTCLIEAKESDIEVRSSDNIAIGILAKFKNVKPDFDNLAIKDTKKLLDILKLFSGEIFLEKKDNILKIYNEKREAEINLSSIEYMENIMKEPPKMEFDGGFELKSSILKNAVKNMKLLKTVEMEFKIQNKKLSLTTQEKESYDLKELLNVDYKDVSTSIGELVVGVINFLPDNIRVSTENNCPLKFTEVNEDFHIQTWVAPIVKSEDEN